MKTTLPSGTVTFLFTDIEGSTRLWLEKPGAMAVAHPRHNEIVRSAIQANRGYLVDIVGDAFCAAFHTAQDGLNAALTAQRGLHAESWGDAGPIRVRMGLHTGEAEISGDGFGKYNEGYSTLATTQRVMSAANGGQVLISQTTHDLLLNALPENVALRSMGEHLLKDLRSPLHLFQLIAPDLPQDFPAIHSLNVRLNNLPIQLTRFIGREKEQAEVIRLLDGTRLLTLTGPGGTGKTRLSLQVASIVLDEFPQGVWLVELAPVTGPEIVVQIISNVFNVRETSGRSLEDALVNYLQYKSLLLVLDNCEHLTEACARLADHLLHACPRLKILATSREPMGIAGEVIFQVSSLSLPPEPLKIGHDSLDEMEKSEAVLLFVERAQAVSPTFQLDEKSAAFVAQICRQLDGIPLAIELAAARIKVLSPSQIASRLNDRFRLLTGGSRTTLPRQHTLKALIDWSWALLSDPEKTLLRRLSVFAGGFTLEAVESICADLDPASTGFVTLHQNDILDLLAALVNKSLIQVGEEAGIARYWLLETIRQYSYDQLVLSREASHLRDRHLEYFTRLAEEAEPHLRAAEMIEWLDILDRDADNLRAAMEWGLENCNPRVLSLVKSLFQYWSGSGLDTEGLHWLRAAVGCLSQPLTEERSVVPLEVSFQRQETKAYLLSGLVMLNVNLGEYLSTVEVGEAAVHCARASGSPHALCYALAMKSLGLLFFEEFSAQARAIAEESLAMARVLGDAWLECNILSTLTILAHRSGDLAATAHFQHEHSRLARRIGNPWEITLSVYGLLFVAQEQEDLSEIRQEVEEVARLFARLKNFMFSTAVRSELAHLLRQRGEFDEARAMYRQTLPEWLELGNRGAVAHQFECLAAVALNRSQPERAARLLGAAHALRNELNSEMAPNERPDFEATLAELRLNLDEAPLQAAWSRGERMGLQSAVAYALEES